MCACGAGGMSVARCFERVGGDRLYVPGEHVALAGLLGAGVRVRGGWRHSMAPSMDQRVCRSLMPTPTPRSASGTPCASAALCVRSSRPRRARPRA